MMRDRLPYALTLAVLVVGFVVGLAFSSMPMSTVLAGLAVLAGSVVMLFVLSRRAGTHHSDENHHHPATG